MLLAVIPFAIAFAAPSHAPMCHAHVLNTAPSTIMLLTSPEDARKDFMSRRTYVLHSASAAAALITLPILPQHASAAATTARVAAYPGLEYLEPIFELKLSLDALGAVASDAARWPALKKRLDSFFGGGPLSEKFYYLGLAEQYAEKISYDDLPEFVRDDKLQRRQLMQDVIGGMEACKQALEASQPDAAAVSSAVASAKRSMSAWLSQVPESDVAAAKELYVAVRTADADRNGKLDKAELLTLGDAERETWKRRVAYVGD